MHAGDFVVVCDGEGKTGPPGWLVARNWSSAALFSLRWFPNDSEAVQKALELRVVEHGDAAQGSGGHNRPRRKLSGTIVGVPFIVASLCFNTDRSQSRAGKRTCIGGVYMS